MKHILAIVLVMMLGIVGCGGSLHTPVRAPDALHSHIGGSTVALVHFKVTLHKDKETGEIDNASVDIRPHCTGVWIGADEMVTAGHCVVSEDVADPIGEKTYYVVESEVKEVMDDPAAIHKAKVVAFDEDHDLAIIKADAAGIPAHDYVSLASEMPGVGEHVYWVGHPRGMYWTYAEGTVSAYREESAVGKVVQVNGTVWFGNSGGGVFDGQGNLLGICSRLTKVPFMNYFVHLDSLKKLLKEYHEPSPDLSKK